MFLLDSISAERTTFNKNFINPTYWQHRKVYSFCKKHCKRKKVLEIGCGDGIGALALSKVAQTVVALDKDESTIRKNRKKYKGKNLTFLGGGFEDREIEGKFDVILAFQLIEHIEDLSQFFRKVKSFSKKGTIVIFSTPNKPRSDFAENPFHYREYDSKELLKTLSEHFVEVRIYGLFGDDRVEEYEELRKKQVLGLLRLDKFLIRRFLPRPFLQFLFNVAAFLNKKSLVNGKNEFSEISEKNYKVISRTENALDLISFSYVK